MFTNILLPVTLSEHCRVAAETAISLAREFKAKLTVFHVCSPPDYYWGDVRYLERTGETERIRARLEDDFKEHLRRAPDCSVRTAAGLPYSEILRLARKEKIDLIVLGPHDADSRRTWGREGSTVEKVSRWARCPVMVVCRKSWANGPEFSKITVATDFSERARCALRYAAEMCLIKKAYLYIVHVIKTGPEFEDLEVFRNDPEKLAREAKERMVDEYGEFLKGLEYSLEVWEGLPSMEILKFAQRNKSDLIILAHNARTRDPGEALRTSILTQVAFHSCCPTLSLNRNFALRCRQPERVNEGHS